MFNCGVDMVKHILVIALFLSILFLVAVLAIPSDAHPGTVSYADEYAGEDPGPGPGPGPSPVYCDLVVTIDPVESGVVYLDPAGGSYQSGMTVTLTAVPVIGNDLDHWGGSLSGTENPTMIVMDADKSINANCTDW